MSNMYLLSFDPDKTDSAALHAVIKAHADITDWSHYLSSSYIIVTNKSTNDLSDDIIAAWPNNRFILISVNFKPGDFNGWMPKKSWEWIKKHR